MVWKDGMLMNPGLLEYRSPSSVESPEIEPIIVESIDPEGPFGAKECSEGSLAATIPAIANAIYDAVGVRLHESPFTPERVLAALRAKKKAKAINLTEGVDPTSPARFREHGGSLWFKGKGPERHALDPSRARTLSKPEVRIESATIQTVAAAHHRRSGRPSCEVYGEQHSRSRRGTDLIPSMRQKLFEPEYVLDFARITELKGITPQHEAASRSAR